MAIIENMPKVSSKPGLFYTPRIGLPITELPESFHACAGVSCGSVIGYNCRLILQPLRDHI